MSYIAENGSGRQFDWMKKRENPTESNQSCERARAQVSP